MKIILIIIQADTRMENTLDLAEGEEPPPPTQTDEVPTTDLNNKILFRRLGLQDNKEGPQIRLGNPLLKRFWTKFPSLNT